MINIQKLKYHNFKQQKVTNMFIVKIKGKSGIEYMFEQHEMNPETFRPSMGIYIWGRRIKVTNSGERYFDPKNIESINSENNLLHNPKELTLYLFLPRDSDSHIEETIEDLKETEDFKLKTEDVTQ